MEKASPSTTSSAQHSDRLLLRLREPLTRSNWGESHLIMLTLLSAIGLRETRAAISGAQAERRGEADRCDSIVRCVGSELFLQRRRVPDFDVDVAGGYDLVAVRAEG